MRYDFVYENNNGEKINLSKLPYKINIEPLIDYSWSYKTKQRQLGNKIVGFFKDIKDSTATLHVLAATVKERDEAIDYFNNVIEKDIYYGTAGKLWLGDWYTYAFITASKNSKWQYDAGIVKKEITIAKEADSWYHITRSANYGEQEESTVYIAEDYIKTYEGRDAESDIKSLTATIVPKQSGSGTPSPDNIRPISGWESVETSVCGKNLYSVSDWFTAYSTAVNNLVVGDTSVFLKAGTYTLSFDYYVDGAPSLNSFWRIYSEEVTFCDTTKQIGYGGMGLTNQTSWTNKTVTFTLAQNGWFAIDNGQLRGGVHYRNIQLEVGSTATEYTPYTAPTTHTTSLGRTVYGGTVDMVSGVLKVTHALVDLGTLNWNMNTSGQFYGLLSPYGVSDISGSNVVCSQYVGGNAYGGTADGIICVYGSNHNVWVRNSRYSSAADFKTAMNGVQLCYELSTPTTYQLTPQQINTLSGVNNVWVDSGDVTVTFRDDHGDIQTESGSIVTFEKKNALSGSGYDYAYDYMHDAQSQKIIANAGSIPCDFIITIQGYADSPIITIGDNTYAVNVEVPYGANLVIDSTQKTVIITLADGTKINAFGARDPDYYLFERIESGKNAVTWDGSYLWELLMIEERSEPRWLTD